MSTDKLEKEAWEIVQTTLETKGATPYNIAPEILENMYKSAYNYLKYEQECDKNEKT